MKNIAKLTLFFTLSFIILFVIFFFLSLLSAWIDLARIVPVAAIQVKNAAETAWKAFPAAIYISALLSLSYTVRRKMPIPMSMICIWILGAAFTIGASMGINRIEGLRPALRPIASVYGKPGLMLSRSDNTMILLRESSVVRGPRVVSIPGQALIYQEVPVGPNNTILGLPTMPFTEDVPWFIESLSIDFNLSAKEFERRLDDSFSSFAVYAFSLILLLGSMRFIMELSQWPLANLFIGALVFRFILALEIFLNSTHTNGLIVAFFKNKVLSGMITPLVFCALSVLVIFYTLMVSLAGSRRSDD